MKLCILCSGAHEDKCIPVTTVMEKAGHTIAVALKRVADLPAAVARVSVEAIIMVTDTFDAVAAEAAREVLRDRRLPIVVFADRSDTEVMRSAIRWGVSSFIIDGFEIHRLLAVMEIASARHEELEKLRAAREAAEVQLSERKHIERAKGILMRRRNMAEASAYQEMRHMASNRGVRVGEIARSIIHVEEMIAKS
jgi:response regulator NasT